jgi:serine protease
MSTANWGPGTDISAPGGGSCAQFTFPSASCLAHGTASTPNTIWRELWSTDNTGTTTPATDAQLVFADAGTSVAAAHVSGAAALLIAAMPTLTPDGVETILKSSSRAFPIGTFCWLNAIGDLRCGAGLLDASAAMAHLTALTPTVSAQTSAAIASGGSTVTLTGAATPGSEGSAAALTYRWQQMSGPLVTLSSTTALSTTFSAPSPGGALSFRFTATDTTGASASATVNMRANAAPTVGPITNPSVRAGQTVTFTATGTDAEADPLTFTATGLPSGASFSAAGVFSWPSPVVGTYTVSVTASDGALTSAARTVTITVRANTAPVVNAITNPSVRVGEAVNFTATGTDAEADPLTFAATGVPTGATFTAAGVFSWPSPVVGTYTVSVTASDGLLTSVARTVAITVRANTAPVVNAITNPSVRAGQAVTFTATGTDAEADPLTFAATGLPGGASFSAAGVFSWPSPVVGIYSVSVTASDGLLTSVARTVTITVRVNTAPTVTVVRSFSVRLQEAVNLNITGTDPENDALTFSATGLPTGATLSSAGALTWASASPGGDYTISVTASDGLLTSAPMSFTITVTNRTTDPGGGGGSMDLLGLALLGVWGLARVRRRRVDPRVG